MIAALLFAAAVAQPFPDCPGGVCRPPAVVTSNYVALSDGRTAEKVEDAEGTHYRTTRAACPGGWTPGKWLITKDSNGHPSYRKWEDGVEKWYYPRAWAGITFRTSAEFAAFVAKNTAPAEGSQLPAWAVKGIAEPELSRAPKGQWIGSQPFAAHPALGKGATITPEDVRASLRSRAVESRPPPNRSEEWAFPWRAALLIAAIGAVAYKLNEG